MKLKKAALSVLVDVKQRVPSLEHVLVSVVSAEKVPMLLKQVDEAMSEGKKGPVDKSKDFRSFLKQQKVQVSANDDHDML